MGWLHIWGTGSSLNSEWLDTWSKWMADSSTICHLLWLPWQRLQNDPETPWASHTESTMEPIGWISLEVGKSHWFPGCYWGRDRVRATSAFRTEGESWRKTQRRDHSLFGLRSPFATVWKANRVTPQGTAQEMVKTFRKAWTKNRAPLLVERIPKGRWFTWLPNTCRVVEAAVRTKRGQGALCPQSAVGLT